MEKSSWGPGLCLWGNQKLGHCTFMTCCILHMLKKTTTSFSLYQRKSVFKGIVHPKTKLLSSFTYRHVITNLGYFHHWNIYTFRGKPNVPFSFCNAPVTALYLFGQVDKNTNTFRKIYFYIFLCLICFTDGRKSLEMHRLTSQWSESADFSHDRHGLVTGRSVSRLADSEPILLLPTVQAETSQPRAHSQ